MHTARSASTFSDITHWRRGLVSDCAAFSWKTKEFFMYGKREYAQINALLNKKLEEKKHLIAVHRGSWHGNIIQNTVPSYIAAIKMGADMVECDLEISTDGKLFSFHGNHEQDVLGTTKPITMMSAAEIKSITPHNCYTLISDMRLNTLEEILDFLPEGILLNIDRSWDKFPQVLEVLDRYPKALTHVLLKAPMKATQALEILQKHPVKYMFMPICYTAADVEAALSWQDINTVGAEIITSTAQDELYQDAVIADIHNKGLFCWVNALSLGDYGHDYLPRRSLFGDLADDISVIQNPDLGWGKLMEKKIDIIQTDWPAILRDYREQRSQK